jgi:endo-1,4-beta-D-glucanase Y
VYASGDAPHDDTVSEAQGYGMNIVALMAGYDLDARAEFDGMWKFVQTHLDDQGMLLWTVDGPSCKYADKGRPDSATDGDLDVGYGFLFADLQYFLRVVLRVGHRAWNLD